MRYQYTSPGAYSLFGGRPRSTIIKILVILNLALWIGLTLTGLDNFFFRIFGLVPKAVWSQFMIWQPVTYMFLHAGIWHVGMNMLVLWMFGTELEQDWGRDYFLRYYMITGIGAGIVTVFFGPSATIPIVGASGAIYGVLLAYGLSYPNREVYLYFMFPVKVKYLVAFLAAAAFFASIQPGVSKVAHLTHLSGMIIGWVYLRAGRRDTWMRLGKQMSTIHTQYKDWQHTQASESDLHLRQEVDMILDKINASGYGSLTPEEQDTLYKASVRFSDPDTKN